MELYRRMTPKEVHAVRVIEQRLSERAGYSLTLSQLFQRWREFVTQVEQGYQDSIYEYTNDLSVRDLLEEILQEVPPSLREKLASWIRPWDARFDNATTRLERAIFSNLAPKPCAWWWFRMPKRLDKELESDLRAAGVLR